MRAADTVVFISSRQAMLEAPQVFRALWSNEWPKVQSQLEKNQRGHLKLSSTTGSRLLVWAEHIEELNEVVSASDFRTLIFSETVPELKK